MFVSNWVRGRHAVHIITLRSCVYVMSSLQHRYEEQPNHKVPPSVRRTNLVKCSQSDMEAHVADHSDTEQAGVTTDQYILPTATAAVDSSKNLHDCMHASPGCSLERKVLGPP